jgi:cell division protein FtsZ
MDNVLEPRIVVVGVGGAGCNAVNNMIQSNLEGVDFLVANTDCQAIEQSLCKQRIQLGPGVTEGLGAGSQPDIGRAAAEETLGEILSGLEGANMVFITAGMGGGTGTGSAPVIARAAREAGILTIAVVTKPFHFEGVRRMRIAETGITELIQYVDSVIVIPNQNLFRVANQKTTFADAFKMADDVLYAGVRGVTDLVVMPGLINLDFADIRAVMSEMGKAMIGAGEAEGENRALAAAEAAVSNPLLDDVSMKAARGVLINITGGPDLTLFEVDETANRIREEVDPEANIIFGSACDPSLEGRMRVSVVAVSLKNERAERANLVPFSPVVSQYAQSRTEQDTATTEAQAGGVVDGAPETPEPDHPRRGESAKSRDAGEQTAEAKVSSKPVVEPTPREDERPAASSRQSLCPVAGEAKEQTAPQSEAPPQTPGPKMPRAEPAETNTPQSAARLSTNAVKTTLVSRKPDREPAARDGGNGRAAESAQTTPTRPNREVPAKSDPASGPPAALAPTPEPEAGVGPRTEPTRQAVLADAAGSPETSKGMPTREAPKDGQGANMRYIVRESGPDTDIYKAPLVQIARIRNEPHADKLKVFDSLDEAKAAVRSILRRIHSEQEKRDLVLARYGGRVAHWTEKDVPPYFV